MMHGTQAATAVRRETAAGAGRGPGRRRGAPLRVFEGTGKARAPVLARALELIEAGRPREADLLLTAELLGNPRDGELWLAAGIARARRGWPASAAAALRMSRWLSGDALAGELLAAVEGCA